VAYTRLTVECLLHVDLERQRKLIWSKTTKGAVPQNQSCTR